MPFDFPGSPTTGQKYTYGNTTYIWNGYGWIAQPIPDFVNVEGDTMTGSLTIRSPGTLGQLILDNPVVTDVTTIGLKKNNLWRWSINATAGPEPGAEVGTNFSIRRYNDAGTLFGDIPLNINRATGRAQVGQQPVDPNDVATKAYVDTTFGGGGPGYLPLTGGTLTGGLTAPAYTLVGAAGAQTDFWANNSGATRWLMRFTDNFELHRYDNASGYLGSPFSINRLTGAVSISQTLGVGGQMSAGSVWSTNGYLGTFSSDNATITNATSYGTFNLTAVTCNTFTANAITDYGALTVNGAGTFNSNLAVLGIENIYGGSLSIRGVDVHTSIYLNQANDAGGAWLIFSESGAPWYGGFNIRIHNNPNTSLWVYGSGSTFSTYGYNGKGGIYGGPQSNCWNFEWGSGLWGWIDNTNLGPIVFNSDYRIKQNVADLPTMWQNVKNLRPISYNLIDYAPPVPQPKDLPPDFDGSEIHPLRRLEPGRLLYKADDVERWGFIAHELQEALIMDAATGEKDAVGLIQSPNPFTILAALVKAFQEAQQRIEYLETRLGVIQK
jgi:hypothetical protein